MLVKVFGNILIDSILLINAKFSIDLLAFIRVQQIP